MGSRDISDYDDAWKQVEEGADTAYHYTFNCSHTDTASYSKGLTMTLTISDSASWVDVVQEFAGFLEACGYVGVKTALGEALT